MKQTLLVAARRVMHFARRHIKLLGALCALVVLVPVAIIALCAMVIAPYSKYILPANATQHERVGVVLGAGVTKSGRPYPELQSRLDVAAQALARGQVSKLILSGDNRFKGYNEPEAMLNYLIQTKHVAPSKLQPDYAGRSTYESCERAAKVFGVHQTILYSTQSHLPRAIYLCRNFGIEAYGVASPVDANNSRRRELLAGVKAVSNLYIYGERTVLGPRIQV